MRLAIVKALPNATQSGNAQRPHAQHVCRAHVVDIGRDPAAIVELPQVRGGLVVAGDEDGEVGSGLGAAVVLVEITEHAILGGDGHDFDIVAVARGLEVSADDEQVDAGPAAGLTCRVHGGVDRIECAVTLLWS